MSQCNRRRRCTNTYVQSVQLRVLHPDLPQFHLTLVRIRLRALHTFERARDSILLFLNRTLKILLLQHQTLHLRVARIDVVKPNLLQFGLQGSPCLLQQRTVRLRIVEHGA